MTLLKVWNIALEFNLSHLTFEQNQLVLTFEQTFPPPFAKPALEAGNGARARTPEHDHDEIKLMTSVKMEKGETDSD